MYIFVYCLSIALTSLTFHAGIDPEFFIPTPIGQNGGDGLSSSVLEVCFDWIDTVMFLMANISDEYINKPTVDHGPHYSAISQFSWLRRQLVA